MRVALLGATGKLGREVLARLVERGDHVTALVRTDGAVRSLGVHEIVGDARDATAVRTAVAGADAVVDAISAGTLRRNDLESAVMAHVVAAMTGSQRLIAMSAAMVAPSYFVVDYLLKPTVLRHILAEHRRVEAIVQATSLDWTIVRPPRMVVGPARGYTASTGARYPGSKSIARADVAELVVRELAERAFVRRAVFVSSR